MKSKKVNQYKCDYCGKKGYSAPHMHKHEEHCTKNPQRKCRMCKLSGEEQADLQQLLVLWPDPEKYKVITKFEKGFIGEDSYPDMDFYEYPGLQEAGNAALSKIFDLAHGCPACILSAIRQSKMPEYSVDFDFKKECKLFWADYSSD